jgi:F0F1-type ATP synthase assembly protein I
MSEEAGQIIVLLFPFVAAIVVGAILGSIEEFCDWWGQR